MINHRKKRGTDLFFLSLLVNRCQCQKNKSVPFFPPSFDLPQGFFIVSPHQAPGWDRAGPPQYKKINILLWQ